MQYKNPIVIAEIGCNHKGDLKIAKKMIESAAYCGAKFVKFQKRDNKYLLGKKYNLPHPVPENSYGKSYGLHRDFLEFNFKEHGELYRCCKKNKISYSTSLWDKKSAENFLKAKIKCNFLKIPSACNLDFDLLEILTNKYKGKLHLSLGMTKIDEIEKIVEFFINKNRNKDLVLYSCTSTYPSDFNDIGLLDIKKLKNQFSNVIHDVGFSGHHLGIAIDIAAYALGANYIERHFTLDRTWKGTDHAASLEPTGLTKLIRDLNNTYKTMHEKKKLSKSELIQRNKLKSFK